MLSGSELLNRQALSRGALTRRLSAHRHLLCYKSFDLVSVKRSTEHALSSPSQQ